MKKKILILDDEESFAKNLKINLESYDSKFFSEHSLDMTSLEVLIADNSDVAFEIINKNQDIELLILDIQLRGAEEGHETYQRIFSSGRAIPAIVVSAFTKSPEKQNQVYSMGVSKIIDKFEPEDLPKEVAIAICEVLRHSNNRIIQLRVFIEKLQIYDNVIVIDGNSKAISEWIKKIITENLSSDEENKIKQAITDECICLFKLEEDHGKGFYRTE